MVKQSHYSRSISEHIVSGLASHKLLKRVARLVPLVERELLTLPVHIHPGPPKKLEDTKGVIRCHTWKKDRQHNGQNKKEK
jgi:hypothetical protein